MTPAAVLFDCDGVLVDSEWLVNSLVAAELSARGWPMDAHVARTHFLGLAWPDMRPMVEARTGPLPAGWEEVLASRIAETLASQAVPVEGAVAAVRRIAGAVPVAVCSNSSRAELAIKLARIGLAECFAGRVFSFEDVPRPKPAPDIYLAAAAACGAPPAACWVVEDSLPGTRAAVAAGCRVLGFARETQAEALLAGGAAEVFADMALLPGLLGFGTAAG